MKISISRGNNYGEKYPKTVEELENAAILSITDSVEFFNNNDVRTGPDGLYLLIDEQVHVFTVEINFLRTLNVTEECPVTFIPD